MISCIPIPVNALVRKKVPLTDRAYSSKLSMSIDAPALSHLLPAIQMTTFGSAIQMTTSQYRTNLKYGTEDRILKSSITDIFHLSYTAVQKNLATSLHWCSSPQSNSVWFWIIPTVGLVSLIDIRREVLEDLLYTDTC